MRTITKAYLSVSELLKDGRRTVSLEGIMCPRESTHLLGKLRPQDAVRINIPEASERIKNAMNREYYEYYEARPLWIKIRLCLFWLFWAAFVAVIVLFALIHWCVVPSLCSTPVEYSV